MENNHIPDASIEASTEKLGYEAAKGRLNGTSCWMPTQNKDTEHLRVNFAAKVTIVAIATQGSPIDDCWVERYSYQWFTGTLHDSPKVRKCLLGTVHFLSGRGGWWDLGGGHAKKNGFRGGAIPKK